MSNKIAIMARIAVQQYVGYVFWATARRTRPKQQWKDAVKSYGRCDTIGQAWGSIAELVNDLPLEAIREDATQFSWKFVRDALFFAGESRRQEGSKLWALVSFERRIEYARLGIAFHEKIKFAESERQRINRERDRQYYSQFTTALKTPLPGQYLKVLGLPANTSNIQDIKSAYRRLVSKHHPDKGGDAGKFIPIRKAYEALAKLAC